MEYHGTQIGMVGSLIQQDYGESVNEHGYLIWDVSDKSYVGVDITSDYGFYTIKITSIEDIEEETEKLV